MKENDLGKGHVALMGESYMHTRFGWVDLQEKNHFKDHGIDGSTFPRIEKTIK